MTLAKHPQNSHAISQCNNDNNLTQPMELPDNKDTTLTITTNTITKLGERSNNNSRPNNKYHYKYKYKTPKNKTSNWKKDDTCNYNPHFQKQFKGKGYIPMSHSLNNQQQT